MRGLEFGLGGLGLWLDGKVSLGVLWGLSLSKQRVERIWVMV